MIELFDGFVFCGECGMPMLSDGKGFYRHIIDLPRKRLKELLSDAQVAGRVFDWLSSVEVACPCCGPKPNPFKEIPREEACVRRSISEPALLVAINGKVT